MKLASNQMAKNKYQFTLIGVFFGAVFPFVAAIIQARYVEHIPVTFSNLLTIQTEQPLLWIIDSAPIFLGLFAFFIGRAQEQSEKASNELRDQVAETQMLSDQLQEQNLQLESIVEERTAAITRRVQYLQAAAEVGRAATSIYSLEDLLPQVTQFISERFGFYQVGIFLIDDLGDYAVLKAASSDGGKRMLARNHKLKVGAEGIVGYVTKTGEVRIALDVGEDAVHFDTPELPSTRSEMALPLFSGGRLYGALDVQSTQSGAFSEDDVLTLRVLADQVSMAINNAMLFEQLQDSLEAERRAYGEINRAAWHNITRVSQNWGYRYADNQVNPAGGAWPQELITAAQSKQTITTEDSPKPTVALPIMIGSEPIGAIRLRKSLGDMPWTQEEIELVETLADRLSQALESARLYQETQQRAAQEQLTSEITANIRETLDVDAVLKTAIKEFSQAFNAKEVVIRMNPDLMEKDN
jgi:GAF domain-containing protein